MKFKKVSADEARARRDDHVRSIGSRDVVVKAAAKEPKSWNSSERSARFVMSSESVDRYRDIVVQSGLDTTRFEENPTALMFHNSRNWPIGNWGEVSKILGGRPKRTEGKLFFMEEGLDPDADRAAIHVAAGTIRTVSIGFSPDWDEIEFIMDDEDQWTGGFRFNKADLLECSLVPIPAQPDALVKDAGGDMMLARELIEDILDTYTKTPGGVLIDRKSYEETYREIVGNKTFTIGAAKTGVTGLDGSETGPADDDGAGADAPETKAVDGHRLEVATEDEAKALVGKSVILDPAHAENESCVECQAIGRGVGVVVGSGMIPRGEAESSHIVAVEFLTDDWKGMLRGVSAERFLLVEANAAPLVPTDDAGDAVETSDAEVRSVEPGEDEKPSGAATFSAVTVDKIEAGSITAASVDVADEVDTTTLSLSVDVDEATEKLRGLARVAEDVRKSLSRFLGLGAETPPVERREPTFEPPPPPSPEAIKAALERAANSRQRLIENGRIEDKAAA